MDIKLPQMNREFWKEAVDIWTEILAALAETR